MPQEYEVLDVTRFSYRYRRWGENMRNYSHPQVCTTMRILSEKKHVSVSDIHTELKKAEIPPSNLSSFLNNLRESNHVKRRGRVYILANNLFYKRLYQAAGRLKDYIKTKKLSKIGYKDVSTQKLSELSATDIDDNEVASVAKVFSDMIYEEASNYLTHILLNEARTFNEIVDIYRTNHGYISPDRLRYYLSVRKLRLFDKEFPVFKQKNKRYYPSKLGETVHKVFDDALEGYMRDSEIWMENLWSKPVKELMSEITAIVHPTDPFFKVLRLIEKSEFVLVQAERITGIITVRDALTAMGYRMHKPGWWTYVLAKDVMKPVSEKDFIKGDITVQDIFEKEEGIKNNCYIIKAGENKFGLLNMREFQRLLNNT